MEQRSEATDRKDVNDHFVHLLHEEGHIESKVRIHVAMVVVERKPRVIAFGRWTSDDLYARLMQ